MSAAGIHRRHIADRQISPNKRYLSLLDGKYIEEYFTYQPKVSAPNGYAAPSGVDTESFRIYPKNGGEILGTYIATGTLVAPRLTDGRFLVSLDLTAEDGVEYNPGLTQGGATAYGPMVLTRGAQAPHFVRGKFTIATVAEVSYLAVGYREEAAVNAVFDDYTDLGAIRSNLGAINVDTISNNAATVNFDTLQVVTDGEEFELKAVLEGFGVRFFFNGREYASKFAFHSSVTRVIPFIHLFNVAAGAGSVVYCSELQAGYLSDVDDHRIL